MQNDSVHTLCKITVYTHYARLPEKAVALQTHSLLPMRFTSLFCNKYARRYLEQRFELVCHCDYSVYVSGAGSDDGSS